MFRQQTIALLVLLLVFFGLLLKRRWSYLLKDVTRMFLYAQFFYLRLTSNKTKYEARDDIKVKNAVLSLTTSPSRLSTSLPKVLHVFARQFDRVELNLPYKYRNIDPYNEFDIQTLQKQFPNLHVYRSEYDWGPVMKVLPTFERYMQQDLVILSLDDDAIPETLALQDVTNTVRDSNNVVTCFWRQAKHYGQVFDIVYGNMGNGYPAWRITEKLIHRLKEYAKECRLHDDFAIGTAFAREGIAVQSTATKYTWPLTLYEGLDGNALWSTDMHVDKEAQCASNMLHIDTRLRS